MKKEPYFNYFETILIERPAISGETISIYVIGNSKKKFFKIYEIESVSKPHPNLEGGIDSIGYFIKIKLKKNLNERDLRQAEEIGYFYDFEIHGGIEIHSVRSMLLALSFCEKNKIFYDPEGRQTLKNFCNNANSAFFTNRFIVSGKRADTIKLLYGE